MTLRRVIVEIDLLIEDDISPEQANETFTGLLQYLKSSGFHYVSGSTIIQVEQVIR